MSLTYGGFPLDMDLDQKVQDFLDQQHREDETLAFPEAISRSTWQTNPVRSNNRVGLPRFNWPAPPPVKINQLYWPCTGATRWAFGLFLISADTFQSLSAAQLVNCNQPRWLRFETPTLPTPGTVNSPADTVVQFPMYSLSANRLAGCHASALPTVAVDEWYLLPLVDVRYWWQWKNAGNIKDELYTEDSACKRTCDVTWADLITYLTGLTGETWEFDDFSAYSSGPDCDEFNRPRENIGSLLDAAAASVGARIVAKLDGEFRVERPETSATLVTTNFGTLKNQTAGSYCYKRGRAEMPSRVEVVAKVLRCGSPLCDDEEYVATEQLTSWCGPLDTVKTIHIPGYADMGCDCDNETPVNELELTVLAREIAADYYASIAEVYDATWEAPQPWVPTGFDDHILIKHACERPDGHDVVAEQDQRTPDQADPLLPAALIPRYRHLHQTRVQSLPLNVGVDCQLHRTDVEMIQDSTAKFTLTEELCRGGCATATVSTGCCGETGNSGIEIEVCDALGIICDNKFYGGTTTSAGDCEVTAACGCVPSGSSGMARFNPYECQWELVSIELCDEDTRYWIEAIDCIIPGETGTGKLLRRGSGGDLEEICSGVTVDNSDCLILALPGERFPVEGTDCVGGTWHPSTTYGLNRRVRIHRDLESSDDCGLACGMTGTATVLSMSETDSGGTTSCNWTESDCEIDVCNQVGYPLACGDGVDHEDAEVRFEPSLCGFVAFKGTRPFFARATLANGLCSGGTAQFTGSPTYPTYPADCGGAWPETIQTADNPYELQGCNGDAVDLRIVFEGCLCKWEIIQIQEHENEVILNLRPAKTCTGTEDEEMTACELQKQVKKLSIHTCDCTTPDYVQAFALSVIDVVIDTGGTVTTDCDPDSSSGSPVGASLYLKRTKICTFPSCGGEIEESIPGWTFEATSVVSYLSFDGTCETAIVQTVLVAAVCDESTETIWCGTDCDTSSS